MIEVQQLTKSYGSFQAVQGISFSIKPGEIFGFLGMNGAGKTTTLRILAGILLPDSGSVKVFGEDLLAHPLRVKAMTGYIPDRPHLYSKLTGREFLQFVADLYGVDGATANRRSNELLEQYALTEWAGELIESYSHGMKQRLATCAALLHSPKFLIIDEPMVGLDPHGALLLKKALKSYVTNGSAVILSTHSLNVAEELSDRVAIIHHGSILTMGTIQEIRNHTGKEDKNLEGLFLELTSNAMGALS